MTLNYDYTSSKAYCEYIGLKWLGDDFVREADKAAYLNGFSQMQVDIAMQHHLWQVKYLFDPKSYTLWGRFKLAVWFLFGRFKS